MKRFIPLPLVPWVQRLIRFPYILVFGLVSLFRPVRANSVILACMRGDALHGNLLFIHNALDETYTIQVFLMGSSSRSKTLTQLRFVVAYAQTEYTLLDENMSLIYALPVRKGARLVQVWHALGAMKLMGFSRMGKAGGPPATSLTHRNYTDACVSSDGVRANYAEAFGIPLDSVHATGVPRTDLFFDPEAQEAIKTRLYEEMPFFKGKRVILLAPTFRGENTNSAYYPSQSLDLARIGEGLGEHDLFVIKMHPFIREPLSIPEKYADRIVDLTSYREFNHLLLVTDLLITDYSSAILDYALLKRPVLFFVPDLADYDGARGFYYPFEDYTYGPVVTDLDSLVAHLNPTLDEDRWAQFCERFLNRCDGRATARFINTVFRSRLPGGGTPMSSG